jgi:hypothetical protein
MPRRIPGYHVTLRMFVPADPRDQPSMLRAFEALASIQAAASQHGEVRSFSQDWGSTSADEPDPVPETAQSPDPVSSTSDMAAKPPPASSTEEYARLTGLPVMREPPGPFPGRARETQL